MHYIVLFTPVKQARQGVLLSPHKSLPSHGLHNVLVPIVTQLLKKAVIKQVFSGNPSQE